MVIRSIWPVLKMARPSSLIAAAIHTTCRRCVQATRPNARFQRPRTFREMGYVMLVIPVSSFCLGVWQVRRRSWKLNLIAELEKRTTTPAVDFPSDLAELEDMEYRKVNVRGSFDHSVELYIHPRSPVDDDAANTGGMGFKAKTGAYVVTAFKLSDTNQRILVNRGWVPRNQMNMKTRQSGQIEGEVQMTAIVRKTEKRPQFGAKNDIENNHWFHRDIEAMSQVLGTEEVFVDADRNSTVPGGPIGGQTRVTVRNEHLSYIFTWFSLSAITSAMWYTRYWKGK